ncbi:MAG: pentapeptide repeat-containing protein [Cyanobacteriota bacterium]|nr:pentapeptide repeat-containing protein [Cyanobacteriota bacterium]
MTLCFRRIRPPARWADRQRRRRRSPFLRLLDHSFRLRLLLASLAALVALGGVNRYELCRDRAFAPGCLWQDAGGVVEVANLEAFSILTAAFLYVLEGAKRRQRDHLEAHQVLLACREAGVRYAPARNDALELLCAAGLEFNGWDLSGLDLDQIQVAGAQWHGVSLVGSTLRGADLRRADLGAADLRGCDLSGADLRGADLRGAELSGATLRASRWDEGTRWPGATPEDALPPPPRT